MKNLQEEFIRLQELNKKKRELVGQMREIYEGTTEWDTVQASLKEGKAKRDQLKASAASNNPELADELEKILSECRAQKALVNDIAMTMLMQGETVDLKNQNDEAVEVQMRVSFKQGKLF